MVCAPLSSIESFADIVVYPTGCSYFFWLYILGAVFVIIAWTLFRAERDRKGEGDMISACGVSSIAITTVATIGTFIKNSAGIPMIQSDVLLYIVAVAVIMIAVWIFKK